MLEISDSKILSKTVIRTKSFKDKHKQREDDPSPVPAYQPLVSVDF